MRMKVNASNLIWILLVIEILIDLKFFYLIDVSRFALLPISILCFTIGVYVSKKKKITLGSFILKSTIISTVISYIFLFVFSTLKYDNQTVFGTLYGVNHDYTLLLVILAFPIMYNLVREKSVHTLFRILNFFACIIYALELLQAYLYIRHGIIFLPQFLSTNTSIIRNGSIRILMNWIGNVMIIYNFYMFWCNRSDKIRYSIKYFILSIIGLITLIFVSKSRLYTSEILISIGIIIFFEKTGKTISLYKKLSTMIIIILFVYSTDYLSNFISSFSLVGEYAYSSNARLYALSYYWEYFKSHPLFGFAFADHDKNYYLIHGDGRAYVADMGIVGRLANNGIFVVFIYVIPLVKMGGILRKTYKSKLFYHQTLYFAFYIFLLTSSVSQIILDSERILFWPIVLSLFEFIYWAYKRNINIVEV